MNALDQQFGRTVEAWNGAKYELAKAKAELAADEVDLRAAERQRRLAAARVEARLVALYESSDDPTTLGIVLGSSNVSDLLDRLDAVQRIAAADHQLAVEATAARDHYAATARRMRATARTRAVALSQLTSERAQIGTELAKRRQLLSSVQSEVAKLKAQEAQQQAVLAAQARARLARVQADLQRRAEQQAAATRAATSKTAADKAAPATPATTTTATEAPPPVVAPTPTTTGVPLPPATPPPAPAAGGHPQAAVIAMRYLGVPYVWGGSTPSGFDCSGLVMYVYGQLGISLPHYAAAQYGFGTPVARDQLQPGDLVFFDGLNHVGIYIGGGAMIHAPHTGDVVRISSLSDFGAGYVGARRI